MPIITETEDTGKIGLWRAPEGALLAAIVALSCTGSFGLGYLSGKESGGGDIIIEERQEVSSEIVVPATSQAASPSAAFSVAPVKKEVPVPASGGQYVASKSGSKYHLPWCPGAKQMKEENKIYFNSKEEAEAAGYTPAANCKGI